MVVHVIIVELSCAHVSIKVVILFPTVLWCNVHLTPQSAAAFMLPIVIIQHWPIALAFVRANTVMNLSLVNPIPVVHLVSMACY